MDQRMWTADRGAAGRRGHMSLLSMVFGRRPLRGSDLHPLQMIMLFVAPDPSMRPVLS